MTRPSHTEQVSNQAPDSRTGAFGMVNHFMKALVRACDLGAQQESKTRALEMKLQEAKLDPLTLLPDRRAMQEAYSHRQDVRLQAARKEKRLGRYPPLEADSLIVFDIDDFRGVNAARFHSGGDKALIAVAEAMRARTRDEDCLARFGKGADEFAILLPNTDTEGALTVINQIRASVAVEPDARVTLSAGIFEIGLDKIGLTFEEALDRADRALYAAKQAGRDQVVISYDEILSKAPQEG